MIDCSMLPRGIVWPMYFSISGRQMRVILAAEADGIAFGAGARRAADAMHVVGVVLRQVVVEHVADVGNVQAARCHVGGDHHRQLAAVEFLQVAQALVLRHVARDGLGIDVVGAQHFFQAVSLAARVHEHHGALGLVVRSRPMSSGIFSSIAGK